MMANARRTRELAERGQAELDAKRVQAERDAQHPTE
jgi:hypothetical protein